MAEITCEHSPCTCRIEEENEYCSPECESAAADGITVIACECGHSTCEASIIKTIAAEP